EARSARRSLQEANFGVRLRERGQQSQVLLGYHGMGLARWHEQVASFVQVNRLLAVHRKHPGPFDHAHRHIARCQVARQTLPGGHAEEHLPEVARLHEDYALHRSRHVAKMPAQGGVLQAGGIENGGRDDLERRLLQMYVAQGCFLFWGCEKGGRAGGASLFSFHLLQGVERERRMGIGGTGTHLGSYPDRLHDFFRGGSLPPGDPGVSPDAVRALGHMRHRYGNELLGLRREGTLRKHLPAERAESLGRLWGERGAFLRHGRRSWWEEMVVHKSPRWAVWVI